VAGNFGGVATLATSMQIHLSIYMRAQQQNSLCCAEVIAKGVIQVHGTRGRPAARRYFGAGRNPARARQTPG